MLMPRTGSPAATLFGPDRRDPLEGIPPGGSLVRRDTGVQTNATKAVEGTRHEVQLRPVDVRRQQTDPGGRPSFREGPRYDTVSRVDPTPAMRTLRSRAVSRGSPAATVYARAGARLRSISASVFRCGCGP